MLQRNLIYLSGEAPDGYDVNLHIDFIKSQLGDDIYIKSACLGDNDKYQSLTLHPFDQVKLLSFNFHVQHPINFQIKLICESVQSDPKFANGYNAIGISQGGLLV